jgi:hypothetical protein
MLFLMAMIGYQAFANDCYCQVDPDYKEYVGNARDRKWVGFSVDWTCRYTCYSSTRNAQGEAVILKKEMLKVEYKERYYTNDEDGREGICEGMIYVPTMNYDKMKTIYMYEGETEPLNPLSSKSPDLKKWGQANSCVHHYF